MTTTFDIRAYRQEHHDSIPVQDHGYSLIYWMADGLAICGPCVQREYALIAEAAASVIDEQTTAREQWHVADVESCMDYELADLPQCCHCYKTIGKE